MLVGITDAGGNLIARYSYDEWGKLLSIEPAEEDNEEQLSIAQLNPLRYRGYYYDTESGLYYINSRYYSPELCRFISCGDYSSIDYSNKYGLNAYSYCYNSPAAFSSTQGSSKPSLDRAEIEKFLKNSVQVIKALNNSFKNELDSGKESLKNLADEIMGKVSKVYSDIKNGIKMRHNSRIDKLERLLNYPDAVINEILSKILHKDVNIRFKIIENLRANNNLNIDLSEFKFKMDGKSGSSTLMKKAKGYVTEVGKVVGTVIVEIFTCLDLQAIAEELGKTFSFNNFEDYMQQKVDLYTEYFNSKLWTAATDFADTIAGYISLAADYVSDLAIKAALTVLPYATSALNDFSGRYISPKGGLIMLLYDWTINLASGLFGKYNSMGDSILEAIMDIIFGKVFDFFGEDSAINYAYNWYLM